MLNHINWFLGERNKVYYINQNILQKSSKRYTVLWEFFGAKKTDLMFPKNILKKRYSNLERMEAAYTIRVHNISNWRGKAQQAEGGGGLDSVWFDPLSVAHLVFMLFWKGKTNLISYFKKTDAKIMRKGNIFSIFVKNFLKFLKQIVVKLAWKPLWIIQSSYG